MPQSDKQFGAMVQGVPCAIDLTGGEEAAVVESVPAGQGFQSKVMFHCYWGQRFDLIKALCGTATGTAGGITRTVPFQYPDNPNAYCLSIESIAGTKFRKRDDGFASYEFAHLAALFARPSWSFDADVVDDPSGLPWTTTRIKLSGEIFSPPGGTYYWKYNMQPVPESAVGLVRSRQEISQTRHWLPYPPIDEVMAYIGTANSVEVTLGNHVYTVGTMLFVGANITEGLDCIGNRIYEAEYSYLANDEVDWNSILARDGNYHLVNSKPDGSGVFPFAYADAYGNLP